MTLYMQQVGIDLTTYITPITYAGGTILPRLHAVFEVANFLVPAGMLLLVCLIAGFIGGLLWVDHRSRKRHGGIRIY